MRRVSPVDLARLEELRDNWNRAMERDRLGEAVAALVELERLDAQEPRWAHRLGEAYRRLGRQHEAEEAFIRAMDGYVRNGFVPRAVAMAKLVIAMNPARIDVLARIDTPGPAPRAVPVVKPPPVPAKAVPLARAPDAAENEVRFDDAGDESSISIVLEDIEELEIVDEELAETVSRPLPTPYEPSIDRLATMSAFQLFTGLHREPLLALSSAAELVEFVPGAMVIVRDEPAFALYAIVGGSARVLVPGGGEVRLTEGDVFGESCLLGSGRRQADVRAETPLMTLRIEKRALDEITEQHPEVRDVLFHLLARRLVANLMQTSKLFTVFEPRVRLEFAQMFEVRRATPGTVLARRGRLRDGLYVLLAGNVMATDGAGQKMRIARGSTFGYEALVGGATADVTLEAESESVVLRLPSTRFMSLAATYPPALALLAELADEPLRPSEPPLLGL